MTDTAPEVKQEVETAPKAVDELAVLRSVMNRLEPIEVKTRSRILIYLNQWHRAQSPDPFFGVYGDEDEA